MFRILLIVFIVSSVLGNVSYAKNTLSRALFVSVIENPPVLTSRQQMLDLIDFAKKSGIHDLFVQVYYAGKAWFPSHIVDDSPYQQCRSRVQMDPLAFLIHQAHEKGLEVHAWINLLSLGKNVDSYFVRKYGVSILTCNLTAKHSPEDYKIDNQYFLEPGDPRVSEDLTRIVQEILNHYPDLDGLQFDYIRYPDFNPHYGYTKSNVERFQKASGVRNIEDGSLVWKNWKRFCVTAIVRRLGQTARSLKPHVRLSTTGCMPYIRAYEEAFQDWGEWLNQGLVDFVTIMDYSADVKEFERWIKAVKEKVQIWEKVKISVGAYKLLHTPKIFEQEYQLCEKMASSCAVFYYGSVLQSPEFQRFLNLDTGMTNVFKSRTN
ncbi:MAG: family 10 glycosylhydrolase [Candidatus Omnitrophica bacterium]|nr:family 10 glycosylhydrolase [Candidatus Omnitrophota bacterium]